MIKSGKYKPEGFDPSNGLFSQRSPGSVASERAPIYNIELETIEQAIESGAEFARYVFSINDALLPICAWSCGNGDADLFIPTWDEMAHWHEVYELLPAYFAQAGVERYLIIQQILESSLASDGKHNSPSSHPDCREKVWVYSEDKTCAQSASMAILRPDGGGRPTLSPLIRHSGLLVGPFAGLLRGRPRVLLECWDGPDDHVCGLARREAARDRD